MQELIIRMSANSSLLKNAIAIAIMFVMLLPMACHSDPGACNCAKNNIKILSNDFDKDLFNKCDTYVRNLSPGETIEYSREMTKCVFK